MFKWSLIHSVKQTIFGKHTHKIVVVQNVRYFVALVPFALTKKQFIAFVQAQKEIGVRVYALSSTHTCFAFKVAGNLDERKTML